MISTIKKVINRGNLDFLKHRMMNRDRIIASNVNGHTISLDVESRIELFRARTYATKEPETLEWIDRYFHPDDVMYDIGANIGLYSLYAAKILHGQCKVYAFEPEALNYAKLSKNIYLNGFSGVILPFCLAVTDKLCFDSFYLNPENFTDLAHGQLVSGSALHSFGAPEDYSAKSFQPFHTQGAVGVSVDEFWQDWGLEFPNHIKIDVDGLEEKIINGAAQTLKDKRLKSVLIEVSASKGHTDPILKRFTQVGFKQVTDFAAHSSESLRGTPYEDCLNSVFIRES